MSVRHEYFMREALALAERGRWRTAPNPTVGAVLVRENTIVAQGWHSVYGQEHAEINCLIDAAKKGVDPSLCTLYVTLEPCNHQGKTPPCTKAILEAGIRHVVAGMHDVNVRAAGGAEYLRSQGVRVEMGVLEAECREHLADFMVWQREKRPYVLLKMASSLDGRIAARQGRRQMFSCEASRAEVMRLREHVGMAGGAVLVGGQTFFTDNPRLTARTSSAARQPLAVVLSSSLPALESTFRLVEERPHESIFFTSAPMVASPAAEALRGCGCRVFGVGEGSHGLDVVQVLRHLYNTEGCPYVLCEGGGRLALSLLEAGCVDEFHLHLAPLVVGDAEARSLFVGRRAEGMEEAYRMRVTKISLAGDDVHLLLKPLRA